MTNTGGYLLDYADRNRGSFSVFRHRDGNWIAMYDDDTCATEGYGPNAHDAVDHLEAKIRAQRAI